MPLFVKGSSPLSVFPTFLLPSSRQFLPHRQQQQQVKVLPKAGKSNRAHDYSHVTYIRCARCGADICLTSQIISKGFTGRHGRAYLVSGHGDTSSSSFSAATSSLSNTITQKAVPRQLVTGAHTVCDLSCVICGSVLGWKYIAAEEESQRYKVGNFIIETKRISISSCWDVVGTTIDTTATLSSPSASPPQTENAAIEFDSQDEDECEDLFAGIWTPALATRRRNRKLDYRR